MSDKCQSTAVELSAEEGSVPVSIDCQQTQTTERQRDAELGQLRKEFRDKENEAQELYDRLLRKQAELENYRKRVQKEKAELARFATEGLISDLLPVMDDFERAIEASHSTEDPQAMREGIKLIFNQLQAVLSKVGLEGVNAVGEQFDPTKHEAVRLIESAEHKDSIVLEELRKGYTLNSRILRPSMVAVTKGKETDNKGV